MADSLEEIFSIPEFFELTVPAWYLVLMFISFVPGVASVFHGLLWMRQDNKITREHLIASMRLKWAEHAIDSFAHLIFLAALSEEDYIKFTRKKIDATNSGRYQMAAFFSAFLWSMLDLMIYGYYLNVAHIYEIVANEAEPEDELANSLINSGPPTLKHN